MAEPITKAKVVIAPKPIPVVQEKKESLTGCKEDSWLYHAISEPKLFLKGEEVPEGWEAKNRHGWHREVNNNFHWRKK